MEDERRAEVEREGSWGGGGKKREGAMDGGRDGVGTWGGRERGGKVGGWMWGRE